MTPDRWERVAQAFEAVQTCSAAERPERLRMFCGDDAELAAEVEALLASAVAASDFLTCPPRLAEMDEPGVDPGWNPGTCLAGRFEIISLLGRGGMGEVYAARDLELNTEVAVKRVRRAIAGDARMLARFKREVLLARRISHPGICRIHDLATDGDEYFLTMELLRGPTLAQWLQQHGPPSPLQVRHWLEDLAAGLDAAHAVGIVHRDLKPGNIILDTPVGADHARAVITDFGLARASLALQEAEIAVSGSRLIGTLAYMAPEQLSGLPVTAAADLYAFGLVAYEMLTGRAAYSGSGPFAGVLQRLQGPFPLPSQVRPELGIGWDALMTGCLVEEPQARFASAAAALATVPETHKPFPSRRGRVWLWAAGTAIVAALATLLLPLYRYISVRSTIPGGTPVLLTSVVNATQDPELNGATVALRQQLAQSAQFHLLGSDELARQLQRMGQPGTAAGEELAQRPSLARELAMRAGAPLVIFAGLTRLAGHYRLELDLQRVGRDPDAPARSWNWSEMTGSKDGIFDIIHDAALWVRAQAGEPAADLVATDQPTRDITTPSWVALSLFTRSQSERAAGHTTAGLALLRAAVAADPQFALAYTRLGDELASQHRNRDAYAAYRKALALARSSRRLSQREQLLLQGDYDSDLRNFAGAVTSFQAYAALYPNDYLGWFYQGMPEFFRGRASAARAAWQQAERLAPRAAVVPANLAYAELFDGNLQAASAAIASARARGDTDVANELDGKLQVIRGQNSAAKAIFARLATAQDPLWVKFGPVLDAALEADLGRPEAATQALRQRLTLAVDPAERSHLQLDLAAVALGAGQLAVARQDATSALRQPLDPLLLGRAGMILARTGDVAGAAAALRRLQSDRDLQPLQSVSADRLQGEILLAQGRPAAAVVLLQRAHARGPIIMQPADLARALLAAGRRSEARDLLRPWVASPARVWSFQEFHGPGAYRELMALSKQIEQ